MKINLQLHERHFERIARFKPINAVKEAIWNSYDADAKNIVVKIIRDNYDLIGTPIVSKVIIEDDGHGLHLDKTQEAFQEFGYSAKSNGNNKSPLGRKMHGNKGEGRYSLFSIGKKISWESNYQDQKDNKTFVAKFSEENHGKTIDILQVNKNPQKTGLTVIIKNITEQSKKELDRKNHVISELLKEFATCLFIYPEINISYDGSRLSIEENIKSRKKYSKVINDVNVEVTAIEWTEKTTPTVFYCDEQQIPIEQKTIKSKHDISVYVSSKAIGDNKNELIFLDSDMLIEELSPVLEFLEQCINDFEKSIISKNEKQLIEDLKKDGVYPIDDDPISISDKHNKAIFDSVVVEINKTVPSIRTRGKKEQKLFNNLLYETVKSSPSSLTIIMSKVVDLTKEDQDRFAELLTKIELSQIIKTIDSVTKRISFLEEIYDLVYTDLGKNVKERSQFQKILEKELWIFGEQYAFSVVDRSIKNVLNNFSYIFNREDIETGKLEDGELIPDICLFTTKPIGDNQYEHLVVEIKRPTKVLGHNELNQIKKYASTISSQPPFQNKGHKWNFILLGKNFDKDLSFEMQEKDNGVIITNPQSTVKVLQWEDIIRNTKRQYEYFREQLQLKITNEDVKEGLKQKISAIKTD